MSHAGWNDYKLGDLCEITSSKRIFADEYVDAGIPFYRSKEIIEKALGENVTECLFISNERFNEIKSKFGSPQSGDVLLSSVGNRSGIAYIVKKHDGDFYFKDGNLIWFKGFTEQFDSEYLLYWFNSSLGQNLLNSIMIGSAQKALTIVGLSNLSIKLPPLPIQRRIAGILSALDEKIELNRQTNSTLEAIAQTIFKEWFVNFNFPGATGEMVESELGMIPRGWRVKNLGEIITNYDSKRVPLSSREREKRKGIYPYYGAASILDYVDDFLFDGVYLLMGEDGTVITDDEKPVLQYVTGKFWVNNHAHVLQGNDLFSTEFVCLTLKNANIKHIVTGAVQPKINQGNMNNLSVIIPDTITLKAFQDIIKSTFAYILEIEQQTASLVTIRDALLPKMMGGKIEV